jgi:hypothetical protein
MGERGGDAVHVAPVDRTQVAGEELTGRTVNVALGSSSPVVVEQWHGRRPERTALALAESAAAVRALLAGDKADVAGEVISTRGSKSGASCRATRSARSSRANCVTNCGAEPVRR